MPMKWQQRLAKRLSNIGVRRFIAAISIAVLLTGCAQKSPLENLADGPCTGAQVELIDKHISGQINALAKRDCAIANTLITQEVSVTSGGKVYDLTYKLSVNESKLGIESASINKAGTKLST
jgi:hypothetical protein